MNQTREGLKRIRDQHVAYARECVADYETSGDTIFRDIARVHIDAARKLNRVQWKMKHGRQFPPH